MTELKELMRSIKVIFCIGVLIVWEVCHLPKCRFRDWMHHNISGPRDNARIRPEAAIETENDMDKHRFLGWILIVVPVVAFLAFLYSCSGWVAVAIAVGAGASVVSLVAGALLVCT